jgi:S1-C subfamily serine protease
MIGLALVPITCQPPQPEIRTLNDEAGCLPEDEIRRRLTVATVVVEADVTEPIAGGWTTRTRRGTGVLVDARPRLVLTAYHVIRDASSIRVFSLDLEGGRAPPGLGAKLWRGHDNRDVAALKPVAGRWPSNLTPLPVTAIVPAPQEPVWFLGAASGFNVGLVLSAESDLPPRGRTLKVLAWSRGGDSGAPAVSAQGRLVGLLTAGHPLVEEVRFTRIDDALAALDLD